MLPAHRVIDLVARKLAGLQKSALAGAGLPFHDSEYQRLRSEPHVAHDASRFPECRMKSRVRR